MTGRLKVGIETEEGTRSTLYDVRGELDRKETLETENTVTDMLGGELRLGSGSQATIDRERYFIGLSSYTFVLFQEWLVFWEWYLLT